MTVKNHEASQLEFKIKLILFLKLYNEKRNNEILIVNLVVADKSSLL